MPEMEEFKGKIIEVNGKKVLKIQANSTEIVHPDGRKDVVVRVPPLNLIGNVMGRK